MTRNGLTPVRRRVLDAIRLLGARGYAPSLAEIARVVGLEHRSAAAYHVRALVKAGLVTRTKGAARSYRVAGGQR